MYIQLFIIYFLVYIYRGVDIILRPDAQFCEHKVCASSFIGFLEFFYIWKKINPKFMLLI